MRRVEGTYEETKGRIVCRLGISEEFRVDVGLRRECTMSTVVHRISGGDQQESEYEGHSPQVDVRR